MVKNKEPEVCTPKIISGVLTFETSRFILDNELCTIITVESYPYYITYRNLFTKELIRISGIDLSKKLKIK